MKVQMFVVVNPFNLTNPNLLCATTSPPGYVVEPPSKVLSFTLDIPDILFADETLGIVRAEEVDD